MSPLTPYPQRFLGSQSGVFLHGNLEARHQAAPAYNPTNRKLFVAEHRIRLRPRYLKNVVNVDTRTTIQGEEITAPICISPTGFHCLVWPDGEMSTARGMNQPHLEAPFPGGPEARKCPSEQ